MIGKSYTINGNNISNTTVDYQVGLTLLNRRKVNTSSEQNNVIGGIGIRVSPVYARDRIVTIEGTIMSETRAGLSKGMDYLDKVFALKSTFGKVDYLNFGIIDEQNREWTTKVIIKDGLEYEINDDDYLDGADRSFRINLLASDPRFFSSIENIIEGIESTYGGMKLGTKLGTKMNEWLNEIICISTGNISSPVKFEITATKNINKPLKILNIVTNDFIEIDEDFISGDKLIIDTFNYTIEKNGISIKNKKVVGSTWLQIKDITKFAIFDIDGGLSSNDLNVKIYFNNVLL